MTLAEKCPHIRRNITQFISKAIEDNAKCLGKQKSEVSRYTQLYKQYISSQHFDFHVTKSYFYEILNTQWHDNVTDAMCQFLSKLVEDCGQEHEGKGRRVVYLPFTSKKNVYQRYIDTHDKELHASYKTFCKSWNKYFPDVYVNRDMIRNNVIKMLSDLAEECGDKQQRNPAGNPSGNSTGNSEGIVYLPYRSKKDVYDLFIAKDLGHLAYVSFCKIWERNIPRIRVQGRSRAVSI